ncbi:MAG: PAS domain S-box protein [Spirochaetales bacterium]|nr:PAS domain S-box protein [Spirochaetales bacterium]
MNYKTSEKQNSQENLFKVFFNAINDAIFIHPLQEEGFACFTEVNDIACRRYGYTRKEFMSLSPMEITRKSDVRNHAKTEFRKKLAEAGKLIIESYHITKSGDEFPVEINSNIIEQDGRAFILAVVRDISERKMAEEVVRKNLLEKETLLKELYHRTKNNMQIICSLIELECTKGHPLAVNDILRQIENKIQTMALVHQKLYESQNLFSLDLKTYLEDLVMLFHESIELEKHHIIIDCIAEEIPVTIETAIPIGLITNELLTNAVKHAFPDANGGSIKLMLARKNTKEIILTVCDDGRGLPAGFSPEKDCHLGLETVFSLSKHQLMGNVNINSDNGCCCEITIPVSETKTKDPGKPRKQQ